jgi:hypothetical protein
MLYLVRPGHTVVLNGLAYTSGQQVDLSPEQAEIHKHKIEGTASNVLPLNLGSGLLGYDDSQSQLGASNYQGAIAALDSRIDALPESIEDSQTVSLYLNADSGNDSNTGLTPAEAISSTVKLLEKINKYKLAGGTLEIVFVEGGTNSSDYQGFSFERTNLKDGFGNLVIRSEVTTSVVGSRVDVAFSNFPISGNLLFELSGAPNISVTLQNIEISDSNVPNFSFKVLYRLTITNCKFRNNCFIWNILDSTIVDNIVLEGLTTRFFVFRNCQNITASNIVIGTVGWRVFFDGASKGTLTNMSLANGIANSTFATVTLKGSNNISLLGTFAFGTSTNFKLYEIENSSNIFVNQAYTTDLSSFTGNANAGPRINIINSTQVEFNSAIASSFQIPCHPTAKKLQIDNKSWVRFADPTYSFLPFSGGILDLASGAILNNLDATEVAYDDSVTALGSTNVQGAIASLTNKFANITGQYIGSAAIFASLPTVGATNGDWSYLSADVIGTGTALSPQYPKGVYIYNGTAYSFGFEIGSNAQELLLSEAIAGVNTTPKLLAASTLKGYVDVRNQYYAKPVVGINPIVGNLVTGDRYLESGSPGIVKTVGGADEAFPIGAIVQTLNQDAEIVRLPTELKVRQLSIPAAETALYYLDPQVQTRQPTNSTAVNGFTTERVTWNVAGKSDPNLLFDADTGVFTAVLGGTYQVNYCLNNKSEPASSYRNGILNFTTGEFVTTQFTGGTSVKASDQIVAGHRRSGSSGLITVAAGGKFAIAFEGGWGSWSSYWDSVAFSGLTNAQMSRWNYLTIEKVSGFVPLTEQVYRGPAPYPYPLVVGRVWEELSGTGQFLQRWFWNGTYWLSEQEYGEFATVNAISATATARLTPSSDFTSNLFLTRIYGSLIVNGTSSATQYWTLQLVRAAVNNTTTNIGTALNTQSLTGSTNLKLTSNLNFHLDVSATNLGCFQATITRFSNPGTLSGSFVLFYRKARS